MAQQIVRANCPACGTTGLYQGFCESEGEAVICVRCGGTGCIELRYEPYAGRKRKRGVKTIRHSRGSFIATGVGGTGTAMTYREFEQKIPEARR